MVKNHEIEIIKKEEKYLNDAKTLEDLYNLFFRNMDYFMYDYVKQIVEKYKNYVEQYIE